jgi:hypothetical protein
MAIRSTEPGSGSEGPADIAAAGSDEDLRTAHRLEQILSRRTAGERLMKQAREDLPTRSASAEQHARQALAAFRGSLDWAEDTEHEEEAHRLLDAAGAAVRRTFGCHLDRDGTQYQQTCPVALGHNRIGMSIGGRAAKRVCSLCGLDVSECEHLPGTAYLVPGGPSDLGWCRVCCKAECAHNPTETYRASLVSIIQEMELHEVSIVTKPAHPEARFHAVSVSVDDLREVLGDDFEPGMDVSCDRCLSECEGLIRHPEMPHG